MLHEYLKDYRLSHNLSQNDMAKLLGTHQTYYSMLETGAKKPGIQLVNRIAKAVGKEPAFIRGLMHGDHQ